MPSSAADSNVSMMVQQFSAQNCRNPPPALLMQLYQEHQRLSRNNSQSPQHAATTVDGTGPYYGKHMVNAENGEQGIIDHKWQIRLIINEMNGYSNDQGVVSASETRG